VVTKNAVAKVNPDKTDLQNFNPLLPRRIERNKIVSYLILNGVKTAQLGNLTPFIGICPNSAIYNTVTSDQNLF
jgi:hypothetical protein